MVNEDGRHDGRPPGASRVDAVLFDVFGTLVTYEPRRDRLGYPRSHQLLQDWGHQLNHSEFVRLWHEGSTRLEQQTAESCREFSMLDAAQAFCQTAQVDLSADLRDLLARTFVSEWQAHVKPVPGVAELIERMARTVRVGVVSNTHDPLMVPAMMHAMGIANHFEVMVLSIEHGLRKPHPTIYNAALFALGCLGERVVFVGDTLDADYHGPRRAGMSALLIDPDRRHPIAPADRAMTVLDVERRLGSL
ncbi:hypothetical protein BH20ACT3_BH20ACT3_00930 [soil metagenome]